MIRTPDESDETARSAEILAFWFGNPDDGYGQHRKVWFQKSAAFDEQIRRHFLIDHQKAAASELGSWRRQAQSCLALGLLLDQFPRHLFRQDARSYATDETALQIAKSAVERSLDQRLLLVERMFLYLPFEHSENLTDQHQAVALMETLAAADQSFARTLDYTYRHRNVIARFGRFPHRNNILGRISTPEELAFLDQPGSRF